MRYGHGPGEKAVHRRAMSLHICSRLMKDMCSSDQPCLSHRSGCVSGQLPCSLFCKCGGSDSCCDQMTKNNMANDANDDEEHSDDEDDGDEFDDYNALLFTTKILNGQLM